VAGAGGVWLGSRWADPVVGVLISAAIFILLRGTARDIGRRLLDGVDPILVEQSERTVAAVCGVATVRSRSTVRALTSKCSAN
jgi:divalent metal cation (Fe/Co/Zn/Cd) transporter